MSDAVFLANRGRFAVCLLFAVIALFLLGASRLNGGMRLRSERAIELELCSGTASVYAGAESDENRKGFVALAVSDPEFALGLSCGKPLAPAE